MPAHSTAPARRVAVPAGPRHQPWPRWRSVLLAGSSWGDHLPVPPACVAVRSTVACSRACHG